MIRTGRNIAGWTSALLALAGVLAACGGAAPGRATLAPNSVVVAPAASDAQSLWDANDTEPVREMAPGLGTQAWQSAGGPDGLRCPTGIAVDARGTLAVVDAGNDRLVRLSDTGQALGYRGRSGFGPGDFRFGLPPEADLGDACQVSGGVAAGADGAIVVIDRARVQVVDPAGSVVATWTDTGAEGGRLGRPAGVAVDARTGHIYVTDVGAACVHKFDRHGRWLLSWGGRGGGPGAFAVPAAVAVDGRGRVYVADRGAERVHQFDADGQFLAAWGRHGTGPGEFLAPRGIAVDRAGRVYVVDAQRVQAFTDAGVTLGDWPVNGGGLAAPGGITVDDRGGVYVTDTGRGLVLHFRPSLSWPAAPTPQSAATPGPTATATHDAD